MTTAPDLSRAWSRCAGRVDDRNQVGLAEKGGAIAGDGGAGVGIGLVRCPGRFARAGFDGDGDALGHQRFQALRQQGDTGLARSGFLENA